mmetsp:Transcript_6024/g.12055  ORF Transcript_6024/g.12055 Transcript_6024/m.12055 type:complete len:130 (+) Transcript_6024:130-519(+)
MHPPVKSAAPFSSHTSHAVKRSTKPSSRQGTLTIYSSFVKLFCLLLLSSLSHPTTSFSPPPISRPMARFPTPNYPPSLTPHTTVGVGDINDDDSSSRGGKKSSDIVVGGRKERKERKERKKAKEERNKK